MVNKNVRLERFKANLESDTSLPNDIVSAHALIRRHLNNIEKESVPKKHLGDAKHHMVFMELGDEWEEINDYIFWKANGHVITIFNSGKIEIHSLIDDTKGELWLSK